VRRVLNAICGDNVAALDCAEQEFEPFRRRERKTMCGNDISSARTYAARSHLLQRADLRLPFRTKCSEDYPARVPATKIN